MRDPYAILGVSPSAPMAEVKAAYRKRARELHPDRNPAPDAAEQFKRAHRAWEAIQSGTARPHTAGGGSPHRAFLEAFTDAVDRAEMRYFALFLPQYFRAWRGGGGEVAARLATDLVSDTLGTHAQEATWWSRRRAGRWARRVEVFIDYRPGWHAVTAHRLRGRLRWRIVLRPSAFPTTDPDELDALVERMIGEQLVSILAVDAGISGHLGAAAPEEYIAVGRSGDDQHVRTTRNEWLFWGILGLVAVTIPFLAWLSQNYG